MFYGRKRLFSRHHCFVEMTMTTLHSMQAARWSKNRIKANWLPHRMYRCTKIFGSKRTLSFSFGFLSSEISRLYVRRKLDARTKVWTTHVPFCRYADAGWWLFCGQKYSRSVASHLLLLGANLYPEHNVRRAHERFTGRSVTARSWASLLHRWMLSL